MSYYQSNIFIKTSTDNMFQNCSSLKELNLFSINIIYSNELFQNIDNLEGCLFNQYNPNMRKCSKYMGFYYCGNCNNHNIDEYCSKEIQGKNYNFDYFFGLSELSYDKKPCFWSTKNYYFDPSISQFKKCNEKCKECELGLCTLCNDGYYKIEEQEYNCSKLPPADNYALDNITNEWRKCDERCKKCYKQTRSIKDHQCLLCNDNYYPYKIEYENHKNKPLIITGFNCYTISEVKEDNINYFLNSNNFFEKCDDSCLECESKSNLCKICSPNYYNILGNKNGTCFKEPLEGYGLIKSEGEIYFKKCFHLCKFCTQITDSFFYQKCKECDEIDYTLDLFSYQNSFCIPKDKSNSSFINQQTKWYIDDFEGIEEFEKKMKILLLIMKEY